MVPNYVVQTLEVDRLVIICGSQRTILVTKLTAVFDCVCVRMDQQSRSRILSTRDRTLTLLLICGPLR